jgi:hypothetical protein
MQSSNRSSSSNYPNQKITKKYIIIYSLLAAGLFLISSAVTWDLSSHLTKTPESFFTPPHLTIYVGISLTLLSCLHIFQVYNHPENTKSIKKSLMIILIGIAFIISSAPLDFIWHSIFGPDALLSPPHLIGATGLLILNVGTIIGTIKIHNKSKDQNKKVNVIMIFLLSTLWYISNLYVYYFTLPFSKGHTLDLNPDPLTAVIISTISFPLISATILVISSRFFGRWGLMTIISFIVMAMNLFTTLIPATSHFDTFKIIPFYIIISVMPILFADIIVNKKRSNLSFIINKNRFSMGKRLFIAGFSIGVIFQLSNIPMITIIFSKFFGLPLKIDELVLNYYKMVIPFQDFFDVFVLFSIIGGVVGSTGLWIIQKVDYCQNLKNLANLKSQFRKYLSFKNDH